MQKKALFVFNGDPMCFIHVLLNALDAADRQYEARVVIEGAAAGLIAELAMPGNPLHNLWEKVKARGLVDGVCLACSRKMGTLEAAKAQGLELLEDMSGHPGMSGYWDRGYEVIVF
jgi:hypothetical protein